MIIFPTTRLKSFTHPISLASVRKGGVEVRRTCARVSTLMPTVHSFCKVGGNLDAGPSEEFGREEFKRLQYRP